MHAAKVGRARRGSSLGRRAGHSTAPDGAGHHDAARFYGQRVARGFGARRDGIGATGSNVVGNRGGGNLKMQILAFWIERVRISAPIHPDRAACTSERRGRSFQASGRIS